MNNSKSHSCQYQELKQNMKNVYGVAGEQWILELPGIVDQIADQWQLTDIEPVNNMSFHFVAKAKTQSNNLVVLKIGYDKKSIKNEYQILHLFNDYGMVKVLNHNSNALLLQQAIPGKSLKDFYPSQFEFVIDTYSKFIRTLYDLPQQALTNFIHVKEWLSSLDKTDKNKFPPNLLDKAIILKNNLLKTFKHEILLHGDLHHDNILQNGNEWIVIDPKGVVGDIEFEAAAFDFIHPSELHRSDIKELFETRLTLLADKSGLNYQRLKDWVYVRLLLSATWSIEDNSDPNKAILLAEALY